jgi:hypothetical protein
MLWPGSVFILTKDSGANRLGFVWKKRFLTAAGLEVEEAGEAAGELAIVAGFVAVEEFGGFGFVSKGPEGEGGFGGGIEGIRSPLADFVFEGSFFEAPESHFAPVGNGHFFEQGRFDGPRGSNSVWRSVRRRWKARRSSPSRTTVRERTP